MKRKNSDIKYVILHHSKYQASVTGEIFNSTCNRNSYFGMPYDIFINYDGTVDLSPRWINAQAGTQLVLNTRIKDIITKYKYHHNSGVKASTYSNSSVHICLAGDIDQVRPSRVQKHALIEVLNEISLRLSLDMATSLLFFSEVTDTTSPGTLFFNKTELLINKSKVIELPTIPVSEIGGYGNAYGGNDNFGYGQCL